MCRTPFSAPPIRENGGLMPHGQQWEQPDGSSPMPGQHQPGGVSLYRTMRGLTVSPQRSANQLQLPAGNATPEQPYYSRSRPQPADAFLQNSRGHLTI